MTRCRFGAGLVRTVSVPIGTGSSVPADTGSGSIGRSRVRVLLGSLVPVAVVLSRIIKSAAGYSGQSFLCQFLIFFDICCHFVFNFVSLFPLFFLF